MISKLIIPSSNSPYMVYIFLQFFMPFFFIIPKTIKNSSQKSYRFVNTIIHFLFYLESKILGIINFRVFSVYFFFFLEKFLISLWHTSITSARPRSWDDVPQKRWATLHDGSTEQNMKKKRRVRAAGGGVKPRWGGEGNTCETRESIIPFFFGFYTLSISYKQ